MNEPKFNWTKVLNTTLLILKITGPLPITPFYRTLSKLYSVWVLSFCMTLSIALQTVQTLFFTKDTKTLVISAYRLLQQYQVMVKMYCVFKNSHVLEMIFHFLNNEKSFQPKTQKQKLLIISGLRFWKKNVILLNSTSSVCCFFWMMYPIFDNLAGHSGLLFDSWFPFNAEVYPYHQITYAYECVGLWLGALSCVNIDSVIFALMIFVVLQCDLLCENVTNIGRFETNDICGDFFRCTQHYKMILRFSKVCIDFFYFIVFMQVATIALCIGLSMFQLTLVSKFSVEFYYVLFYLVTVTFQMFQYCWFGNEVLVKSGKISTSAFEMNFIDAPLHVRKNLAFFITRTQRPIKIPVLNLTFLSLQTFIKILRTAWSYFALLYQVGIKN